MKKIIRLTESDLHKIVKESVKMALREEWTPDDTIEFIQKKREDEAAMEKKRREEEELNRYVILEDGLYGEITYIEYFNQYRLDYGNNVYYFPKKEKYQEGSNWKVEAFDSYDECLKFCEENNIKIVGKHTVKSPFSNGLPDPRYIFQKRSTPYSPSEDYIDRISKL